MKMNKKIIMLLNALLCILLCSCSNVNSVNESITKIVESGIPTQNVYDEVAREYNELSASEKEKIEHPDIIEKYSNVDLGKVIKIQEEINCITNEYAFSNLLAIMEQYNALTAKEKKIVDKRNLENAMVMNDYENAAFAAAKNVKSVMKNQDSFKVNEVTIKDETDNGMGLYFVLIEYSGQNSFGGTRDYTSCFSITPDFVDPFWGLAILSGIGDYLDSTVSYMEFFNSDSPEIAIDVDKISYYLSL